MWKLIARLYLCIFSFLGVLAYTLNTFAGVTAYPPVEGPVPGSKITMVDILATTDGTAVGTFTLNGYLHKIVTVPDIITTPSVTPLAAWDCVATDKYGQDIATGAMVDRINTMAMTGRAFAIGTASYHSPMVDGWIKLLCSNMGTNKHAYSYFYTQDKPGP